MGEGRSHWSSMVLRKSQTCFFDRHTHPNSMYSNFCHVLKISMKKILKAVVANPKYYLERLTGKKRISCTDYSYFMNNGKSERLFYKLIELLGNKYNG